MNDKYKNAISKINASEELKTSIILKMKEAQKMYVAKEKKQLKIKEWLIKISAIAGIVACSGVAYASIKGKTIGRIKFSENYEEYNQQVENQYIEKDGNIVSLKSYVCDDGFLVLKFNITLSDKATKGLTYLSFNDEIITEGGYEHTNLSGANYNLIIDGENYWLRGKTENEMNEINEKEYEFYQLYFLTNDILAGKENFTITLNDVILSCEDDRKLISMDDGFEIEVSKEKTLKNTTKFEGNSETITYKTLSQKIETVSITPLQNIVKISNILDIVNEESLVYLPSYDYVGTIIYKVYDQNGNELSEFDATTYLALEYADGTREKFELDLGYSIGDRDFTNVKQITTEYLVIEQNKNITKLNIEVFERNEYYEEVRKIGTYSIDLNKQTIETKNTDELITSRREEITQEELKHTIDISEIEGFTIEIPESVEYTIKKYENEIDAFMGELTEYSFDFGYKGSMCLYLVKGEISQEAIDNRNDGWEKEHFIIVDKNDEYTLALEYGVIDSELDNLYEVMKDIIKSIKLK